MTTERLVMRGLLVVLSGAYLIWVVYFFGHRGGDTGWTAGYSRGWDDGTEDGRARGFDHGFDQGYVSCQAEHACPLSHRYLSDDMRAICYTEMDGAPTVR
jgi:hypothetical protein